MLQLAIGLKLALIFVHFNWMFGHADIEGPLSGPLKKLVDGTVTLAYQHGCLDGFLVGSVLVLIILFRRHICNSGNSC